MGSRTNIGYNKERRGEESIGQSGINSKKYAAEKPPPSKPDVRMNRLICIKAYRCKKINVAGC